MQNPLFSIVTIVFNGAKLLPVTAEAVLAQTFTDYEYLLIDGASKDGTTDLIKQYATQYSQVRYVSEPDKGLYDAMNKGIALARGQYIWFMNAGDTPASATTLQAMADLIHQTQADVLYGDTMLVNEERAPLGLMSQLTTRTLPDPLTAAHYLYGMRVVHQSFVPKISLIEPYATDNLCADYAWCIDILRRAQTIKKVPVIALSNYLAGGVSKQRHQQSLKDRFAVMQQKFGLLPTLWAHFMIVLRAGAHRVTRMGKENY
jgi:glycosyltransferase involved in cell wall biosynthesis